jgi:hypothetical protein
VHDREAEEPGPARCGLAALVREFRQAVLPGGAKLVGGVLCGQKLDCESGVCVEHDDLRIVLKWLNPRAPSACATVRRPTHGAMRCGRIRMRFD